MALRARRATDSGAGGFFLTILLPDCTLGLLVFPCQEVPMRSAAVGFRAHSGWTALVTVCLEKNEPLVLSRQRVHLVKTFNYSFRQPYHTAEKMSLSDGRKFISQVRTEARRLAYRAIREVQANLGEANYQVTRCGLLRASGRDLPNLEKILAAHTLIHTADGELFRE